MDKLPEIELFVSSIGITIASPNLTTPRWVPFDLKGRCNICYGSTVEVDYVLQPDGITIFCSRLKKEKYINFDKKLEIDSKSMYRLRTRNKVYNIPIKRASHPTIKEETSIQKVNIPPTIVEEIEEEKQEVDRKRKISLSPEL